MISFRTTCTLALSLFVVRSSLAQNVAINSTGTLPNSSAMLDVSAANKGLLIPRVSLSSTTDVTTIPSPATSLLVYNTNAGMTGGGLGYWYWDGVKWVQLVTGGAGGTDWLLLGNAGTVDGTNFIGTTDNVPFNIRVNNQKAGRVDHVLQNTYLGYQAGNTNTTGIKNTALGQGADMASANLSNATAIGYNAIVGSSNALVLGGTGINSVNVGIGTTTPNPSAKLDITSTNSGLLIPRVSLLSTTDVATILSPVTSTLVYNNNAAMVGGSLGYWYWDGVKWVQLMTSVGASNAWLLLGNSGTVDGTNFIGTTDNVPFNIRVNNQKSGRIAPAAFNTFFGYQSANANTTGTSNTALGHQAMYSNTTGIEHTATGYQALYSNTTGTQNTAIGNRSLYSNSTGVQNTGVGYRSLYTNTTGTINTAIGHEALKGNTSGNYNTAVGNALVTNTTGSQNTAVGSQALFGNTTGANNTALGADALKANTTGYQNTALGNAALTVNTTGSANTASGNLALGANTSGNNSTAHGYWALYSNTTGNNNTAIGSAALYSNTTGNMNTASGYDAMRFNTTGRFNTANGWYALRKNTTGSSNVAMGAGALYSNTTRSNIVAVGDSALYFNGTSAAGSLEATANTAVGSKALHLNTTGYENTAHGWNALYSNTTGSFNTATGKSALTSNITGNNNTAIGYGADVASSGLANATAIGSGAIVNASNKIQIGNGSATYVQLGTGSNVTLETGLVKLTGGSPGLGKVLTSDGAGLASWQNPAVPQDELVLVTHSSFGTVNTTVPRFASTLSNTGSGMTFSDSPTDGTTVTINTSGVYYVSLQIKQVWNTNPSAQWGIMKNAGSDPGLTSLNRLCFTWNYESLSTAYHLASATVYLTAGDVVRPFCTTPDNNESRFEIRRVH